MRTTWLMTPLLVSNSAVGDTLMDSHMSWKAANVLLIWRLTTARPSKAGLNPLEI